MNKEQIAFEKWDGMQEYTAEEKPWEAWQARAELDKQDSLEIVSQIEEVLKQDNYTPLSLDTKEKLLTKIRKHLKGEGK
jgi:hypothetical protein